MPQPASAAIVRASSQLDAATENAQARSAAEVSLRRIELLSDAHCGRRVFGIETSDVAAVNSALARGAMLQATCYRLRFPEVMLSDLSNPDKRVSLCDSATILEFHRRVREILSVRLAASADTHLITGQGLSTEVAICGPSKDDLKILRDEVTREAAQDLEPWSFARLRPYEARALHESRPIRSLSAEALSIQESVVNEYEPSIYPEFRKRLSFLHPEFAYQNHFVWAQISRLGHNKVFVLGAGLRLALGYVNATSDSNVGFLEFHRQNDVLQLYRRHAPPEILSKCAPGRSWVVIDKAYTGGTAELAAERLRELYGNVKITKVALFPKSIGAIASSDYFVYAGRLYCSRDVLHRLTAAGWHHELMEAQWLEP